jgi:hypothetical protein
VASGEEVEVLELQEMAVYENSLS